MKGGAQYCHEYDLLISYTHDSELQAITATPLHRYTIPRLLCPHQPLPGNGSNSADSSASRTQILSSQHTVQNSTIN
jgi:hypothetical protein